MTIDETKAWIDRGTVLDVLSTRHVLSIRMDDTVTRSVPAHDPRAKELRDYALEALDRGGPKRLMFSDLLPGELFTFVHDGQVGVCMRLADAPTGHKRCAHMRDGAVVTLTGHHEVARNVEGVFNS